MNFKDLHINPSILQAIEDQNYNKVTPIQEKAIPIVLNGRDLLACAQTGTGKTAAFALPILHMLSKEWGKGEDFHPIRALVLAPTRELALQISDSFKTYGQYLEMLTAVVYGGVPINRNIKALKREPSILVATPGRLLDLIDEGMVDLDNVEFLVLDEADRMLDLGMIQDVKAILSSLPAERQNLLFSATLPDEISKLSNSILKNPARVEVKGKPVKKAGIKQKLYYVDEPDKISLLLYLLKDQAFDSVLVFVRTKKKADQVLKAIQVANISVGVIHGDKNQTERVGALSSFKNKEIRVLVATDVAARGIDIDRLSHVVNLNIPAVSETYIHRIGRTGRAGMSGIAISFCNNQEIPRLKAIEKLQGIELACVEEHPYVLYNIAIKQSREKYRESPMSKGKPKKRNEKSSDKKRSEKPNDRKRSEKPNDRKRSEKPNDRKRSEKPSDRKRSEKPSDRKRSEKPSDRKRSEKPSDRKRNEKPSSKKRNEKPSNQKKKLGNPKSNEQQANKSKSRSKDKRKK